MVQLYYAPLSPSEKTATQEQLLSIGLSLVEASLDRLSSASAHDEHQAQFLKALFVLSECDPKLIAQLAHHWGFSFLLAQCAYRDDLSVAIRSAVWDSAAGLLLGEWIKSPQDRPSCDLLVTTGPVVQCLTSGFALLDRLNRQSVTWTLTNSLKVDGQLYGSPEAGIETSPFRHSDCWNVPVLDDSSSLGLDKSHVPEKGSLDQAQVEFLSLGQSLEGAHQILSSVWPEVVAWTTTLVPAFVEINCAPSVTTHKSASYDAGSPVFLSRVIEPFLHAEDIVHEVQHKRFYYFHLQDYLINWESDVAHTSPYRTDPRPIRGVLLGLHAFLAVNEMRLRALQQERQQENPRRIIYSMVKTHEMNAFAFDALLRHGQFTSEGAELMKEMKEELYKHRQFLDRVADSAFFDRARALLAAHVRSVSEPSFSTPNQSF